MQEILSFQAKFVSPNVKRARVSLTILNKSANR